jgi:hypothetical protein
MPYIVTHDGGTKESEFEAYVRLLEKWGIDRANAPRTLEPGTWHRWIHVWENDREAERFSRELGEATGDDGWRVDELDEELVSEGALGPVEIYIGRQSDGCAYGLHPNSRVLIKRRFPHARPLESVFIRTEDRPDAEDGQSAVWPQVALLLTGLSEQELQELGGYRLYDPVEQKSLREPVLVP